MKILVVVPFYMSEWLTDFMRENLPPDVDVIGVGPKVPHGEGRSDVAYTSAYVMDAIVDAEKKGYDAVIQGGNPDPLVQEARERVDIPVLGPGMTSAYIGLLLGHRLCIFAPSLPIRRWVEQNVVRQQGFDGRIVVRHINATALECCREYYTYKESGGKITPFINTVVEECIRAIEENDVGVISFGCGGLIWAGEIVQKQLRDRGYGAVVINPILTAIEIARALVNLKLTHSRITYPKIVRLDA